MLVLEADLVTVTLWLVAVTGALAIGTVALAMAGVIGVVLQRQELMAVGKQIDLTNKDFEARHRAASPLLDVAVEDFGRSDLGNYKPVTGKVRYAAGIGPATNVRVWIHADQTGRTIWPVGTVSHYRAEVEFPGNRDPVDFDVQEPWPFQETLDEWGTGGLLIGLTWTDLDGGEGRYLAVYAAPYDPSSYTLISELWNQDAR